MPNIFGSKLIRPTKVTQTMRAVNPDPNPHGSAFIFPLGSGSGSRRERFNELTEKGKEVGDN